MASHKGPKVGVAVIVLDERGRLLLAERYSDHEHGRFGCPGGKVDWMERPIDAAIRELREETDLIASEQSISIPISPLPIVADCAYPAENNHFICLWFHAKVKGVSDVSHVEKRPDGSPKHGPWKWYDESEFKEMPLMLTTLFAYDCAVSGSSGYQLLNVERK
jgi:8-oxo-dGTP diphosphatase